MLTVTAMLVALLYCMYISGSRTVQSGRAQNYHSLPGGVSNQAAKDHISNENLSSEHRRKGTAVPADYCTRKLETRNQDRSRYVLINLIPHHFDLFNIFHLIMTGLSACHVIT